MRCYSGGNLVIDHVIRSGNSYLDINYNGKKTTRQVEGNSYDYFRSLFKRRNGCKMRDILTGTTVDSKGWKSMNGSIKHAAEELVKKLISNGQI